MRFTPLTSFCFGHRLAMLTIATTLALVGCDDSSTDPDNPADALVGSWALTSETLYYGSSIASPDSTEDIFDRYEVLTFNADGTGKDVFTEDDDRIETINYTYTATDTEITLTSTTEGTVVLPYELSGNTLTFTKHKEADDYYDRLETWLVTTFTKQ